MSSNQVVPLFGGHTTQQGQKITGSLVRQTKREVEQVELAWFEFRPVFLSTCR